MNEQEALARMIAPGTPRPTKWLQGVVQIQVTRACDRACVNCTTGSQLAGEPWFMTPAQFERAVLSLAGYSGVYGLFGGNPALSPHFHDYCAVLRGHVPFRQRGIWCNNPVDESRARAMRETFNPGHSNLNCHLDEKAYRRFKDWWPESHPFGLTEDSRHSPPFVAMRDVVPDEGERWALISGCDLNHYWSASISLFRGELRAYFCELAGSMASLHGDDPAWPDTGLPVEPGWWRRPMTDFAEQVRWSCHRCGVPLRGYGALAQDAEGVEQVSATHARVYRPKRKGRKVEVVTDRVQLGVGRLLKVTDYLGNARR